MDRRHRRAIHSVGVVVEDEAVQSISAITVESVRVPDLPVEMRRRIVLAWGDEARAWLDAVPLIAARRSDAWNLELAETIVGGFDSWVLTCADELGQRRILKLTPDRRSARAQAETLRAWGRVGVSGSLPLTKGERDPA